MAGIKDLAVGRGNLYAVDPRQIVVIEGWNARKDLGDIEGLKRSIIESGLKEPLKGYVEDGKITLTNGHRRLTAILQAIAEGHEIVSVPFLTESKFANEADYLLTQILSNDGKPLTPAEMGEVFKRLHQFGWTVQQIAQKTGRSATTVNSYLELTSAPPQVLQMVNDEQVSATLAMEVLKESPKEAREILETAVETAKAQGKTKATRKHLPESDKKPHLKKALTEMILDAKVATNDTTVDVTFDRDQWEQIKKLIGMD